MEFEAINLATGERRKYDTSTAAAAVIAAYAQVEKRDWNTWAYWDKYSDKLVYGKDFVSIGDWTCKQQS